MAYEIERKFLLKSDAWRYQVFETIQIKQAYLCNTDKASLRVRVTNKKAYISTKTMTYAIRRHEFEYEIPVADAEFMLQHMCQGSAVIKQRHLVKVENHVWEIDEFDGDNKGLLVAEIELEHETQPFNKPDWVGKEVSDDIRYLNVSLVNKPYKTWTS
jgi:adenylate cyclase